jgi:hypothetical protein
MSAETPTSNLVVIAAAVGGSIGFISSILTTIISNYSTARREAARLVAERDQEKRTYLRAKLEELINDLMAHLSELEVYSLLPIPLAATLVAKTQMPWKHDEDSVGKISIIKAETLVALYFPDLVDVVTKAASQAFALRRLIAEEIDTIQKSPEDWLRHQSNSYNERCRAALDLYKDALLDAQLLARKMLDTRFW